MLRDGLPALTLRAIAREAGVSHGAPAHHFPDLPALLSELAAVGFQRISDRLEEAVARPGSIRRNAGHAYLAFALENRAMFLLMFREDRLDPANPALGAARMRSSTVLSGQILPESFTTPLAMAGAAAAAWCTVHGFTMLAIENRLTRVLNLAPGTTLPALLDAAFDDLDSRRLDVGIRAA